jgi:hypothetical protein
MDLADLKRLATAAREISVAVGGATAPRRITLRLPTQHQLVLSARRSGLHNLQDDAAAHVVLQRNLLLLAMVAWSGVLVSDVLPGHPQDVEPLDFSTESAELWIDAHPDWEAELSSALMTEMASRKQIQDTATKN